MKLKPNYQVDLIAENKQHFYDVTLDGKTTRYPGVTGFLTVINRPALIPWARNEALAMVEKALKARTGSMTLLTDDWIAEVIKEARKRPDKIKDEAADLGTQAHVFIDKIIHGEEPKEIPPDIEIPVLSFKEWWRGSGIEIVFGDTKVASVKYGYGGSLDSLGRIGTDYVLIDFKTSKSAKYVEYALQVAAYTQALKETYDIECKRAVIMRFSKVWPVEFEVSELQNIQQSFDAFIHAKKLKELLEREHFFE